MDHVWPRQYEERVQIQRVAAGRRESGDVFVSVVKCSGPGVVCDVGPTGIEAMVGPVRVSERGRC